MDRVKEYLKLKSLGAKNVYPESSFTIDVRARGDVVKGDTVLFTQAIYAGYDRWDAESAEPIGERIVAAHVTKEGYGADNQQHTFTLEVLWTSGLKPLGLMASLLIKGRNLFNTRTLRQKWPDENKRKLVQAEQKRRASDARLKKFGDANFKDADDLPNFGYAEKTFGEFKTLQTPSKCSKGACKQRKAKDCSYRMCGACCKHPQCPRHGKVFIPEPEYDSDEEKYVHGNWYSS